MNYLRLRHEDRGEVEGAEVPMDSTEIHELGAVVRGDTIAVEFDGQTHIEHVHSDEIGGGSVGFGIGFERATWYDNLRVELL